jgi:hypothetical protein
MHEETTEPDVLAWALGLLIGGAGSTALFYIGITDGLGMWGVAALAVAIGFFAMTARETPSVLRQLRVID